LAACPVAGPRVASLFKRETKMTTTWRRVIASLEIIGGLSGVAFTSWLLLTISLDGLALLLAFFVLLVYLFSLVAGILLWREHRAGRTASIIVQIIQLPKIVSPQLIFIFCFGFDLYPHITIDTNFSAVGIELKFLAFFQLFFNSERAPISLGVSLPALFFLLIMLMPMQAPPPLEEQQPPPPPVFENTGSQ
jgi:hypothetical protein